MTRQPISERMMQTLDLPLDNLSNAELERSLLDIAGA